MNFRLLITGANGFLGRYLCEEAKNVGFLVRAATRVPFSFSEGIVNFVTGNIDANTDWTKPLLNCDVVIHLAASVHVMHNNKIDSLNEFRRVNVLGTKQLAKSAAMNGVKRFIYVSSIHVNGLFTDNNNSFSEEDIPKPCNNYSISKWEAEIVLKAISEESNLEIVIIRPPLIYGLGAPGNFDQILRILKKNIPLPFLKVKNKRDFIYVKNLVSALLICTKHPKAAGQIYLVCDGQAVSTANLIKILSKALGNSVKLFGVPLWILRLIGKTIGKSSEIEKLLGSLQINSSKIRSDLGWTPPYKLQEGLNESVIDF
jgi:nucleoside-diphosphate-sugar epimerase